MHPVDSSLRTPTTSMAASTVRSEGRLHISIPMTEEIRDALAEVEQYNLKAILFECRYIRNVCEIPWHTSYFVGTSATSQRDAKDDSVRVSDLLQTAIRDVMKAEADDDLDLQISLSLTRDPSTGIWAVKGSGTVWQIIEYLDDISMSFT